jgi:hypothetical protein
MKPFLQMKIITLTNFTVQQKESVFKLWNEEYPNKLQYSNLQEFDNYLNALFEKKHYLLLDEYDDIVGWASVFSRENARWFSLILSSANQGVGYGTILLNELKKEEKHLFGWVIDHNNDIKANGNPYLSPLIFYRKNNFIIHSSIRLELEKISAVKIEWLSALTINV